jgi:ribose-phosphate pyrophosphokinase
MPIFVNDKLVETFKFPAGECHVKIDGVDISKETNVQAYLNNSDDIIGLLLTVDAIRRLNPNTFIYLTIPYFPYARQDRVCNEGESLSVKVMADLINNLQCARVTVCDPHSDVTTALLNNCTVVSQADILLGSNLAQKILEEKLALVSPDAGAEKKTRAVAKLLSKEGQAVEVFCSSKARDTLTGKITATEVYGDVRTKKLIVLDDICDGGKTFIELAQVLKQGGATEIYLYVTHGIFSKGLSELKNHFKHVYCFHTMLPEEEIDCSVLTVLRGRE